MSRHLDRVPTLQLYEDLDAIESGLSHLHGCRWLPLVAFENPITLGEVRADPILREWNAYKVKFVRASFACPEPIWNRLVALAGETDRPSAKNVGYRRTTRTATKPRPGSGELRRIEAKLEAWLIENISALRPFGLDVEVVASQVFCGEDHGGTMDVLCRVRDPDRDYVVIELKAGEARRDAQGQVLGYMGWLREQPDAAGVSGVLIGLEKHPQLDFGLRELSDRVRWISWSELPVPQHLRDEVS